MQPVGVLDNIRQPVGVLNTWTRTPGIARAIVCDIAPNRTYRAKNLSDLISRKAPASYKRLSVSECVMVYSTDKRPKLTQ